MKQLPAFVLFAMTIMVGSAACDSATEISHPVDIASNAILDSLILHQRYDEVLVENARVLRQRYDSFGITHVTTIEALDRLCHVLAAVNDELWQDLSPRLVDLTREVYGPTHPKYADALARYALLRSRKERGAKVLPVLEEALRLIEPHREDDWRTYVDILQAYGHYNRWVDGKKAVDVKVEALAIRRAGLASPHVDIASNLLWLGFTMFFNGDHQEGLQYLQEAEEQFQALGLDDLWQMGTIQGLRGEAHVLTGELAEAEGAFQLCAKLHKEAGYRYPPGFGELPKHGFNLLPHVQIKLGKELEAWQSLQEYREQSTVDYLVLRSAKWEAPQEYARLQRLGHTFLAAHARRVMLDPQSGEAAYWDEFLDEITAKAALDVARRSYLSAHLPEAISLEELQSHLGDSTAYMGWHFTAFGDYHHKSQKDVFHVAWAYVIRSSGPVQWIPLFESRDPNDPWDALGSSLNRMWPRLDNWGMPLPVDPRLHAEAQKAGARLLDPLAPYLEGIDELVVEYSGFRIKFPVETLVAADGQYYGDRFAISYSPCARSFVMLSKERNKSDPANYDVLVVGDPVFLSERTLNEQPPGGGIRPNVLEELESLARLTYSGAEASALAHVFDGATVMVREAASAKDIRELVRSHEIENFDILHFATHALITWEHPEAPC